MGMTSRPRRNDHVDREGPGRTIKMICWQWRLLLTLLRHFSKWLPWYDGIAYILLGPDKIGVIRIRAYTLYGTYMKI